MIWVFAEDKNERCPFPHYKISLKVSILFFQKLSIKKNVLVLDKMCFILNRITSNETLAGLYDRTSDIRPNLNILYRSEQN